MLRALTFCALLSCLPLRAESLGKAFLRVQPAPELPLGLSQWDCPNPKGINIVIVWEAYTASQLKSGMLDALRLRQVFQSYAPFSTHVEAFNWWILVLPSNESGSGSNGKPKDTAWQTWFGDRGVTRLIGCPPDTYYKLGEMLWDTIPNYIAVLMVNDSRYGGGGGSPLTVSAESSSGKIFVHEFGHAFGNTFKSRLGDEYPVSQGALPYAYINVSLGTNNVPWAGYPGTKMRKIDTVSGVNRYAPSDDCIMGRLAAPGFCSWCLHVMTETIEAETR